MHKTKVRQLLVRRDHEALLSWADSARNPMRILISLAYDEDELIRWRVIEATGKVAALHAESNLEKVRDIIRRLLWLMNDESGGLLKHSPELIGEILVGVPVLIPEYAELLPSFLKEEPFEQGTHFAIFRVASVNPNLFLDNVSQLSNSLKDVDPMIRSYALLALSAIGGNSYLDNSNSLIDDHNQITMYDFTSGRLQNTTVGEIAKQVINVSIKGNRSLKT